MSTNSQNAIATGEAQLPIEKFLDKNEAHLCGDLARDPEIRYTESGKAIAKLSLCTKYKESHQFHQLVCWEELAQKVAALKKGARIKCVGRLQTSSWEKAGQKYYKTEVICWQITVEQPEARQASAPLTPNLYGDEDIPF
jgi:single-strand DNA-binding protein